MENVYFPYFRGKQYELIAIREKAALMATSGICPIIEPVRDSLKSLERALNGLRDANCSNVLIVNSKLGDRASLPVGDCLDGLQPVDYPGTSAGFLMDGTAADHQALSFLAGLKGWPITFLHRDVADETSLRQILATTDQTREHVFIPTTSLPRTYQKKFAGQKRILVRDGFRKRDRNRDYPDEETFSDLHSTYREEAMDGFGDFLVVGDEYSESGGPAYSVAIHLTFLNTPVPEIMRIRHFKSDRAEGPTDPGGKYLEAVEKLVDFTEAPGSPIMKTSAYDEFRRHRQESYYPGLGYVKKLSMCHHLETLANYLRTVGAE